MRYIAERMLHSTGGKDRTGHLLRHPPPHNLSHRLLLLLHQVLLAPSSKPPVLLLHPCRHWEDQTLRQQQPSQSACVGRQNLPGPHCPFPPAVFPLLWLLLLSPESTLAAVPLRLSPEAVLPFLAPTAGICALLASLSR